MAKLFVIGLFTWRWLMILETWFIWVSLIAAVVTVLTILFLLTAEQHIFCKFVMA